MGVGMPVAVAVGKESMRDFLNHEEDPDAGNDDDIDLHVFRAVRVAVAMAVVMMVVAVVMVIVFVVTVFMAVVMPMAMVVTPCAEMRESMEEHIA